MRSAWLVSLQSVVWTVSASCVAIGLGVVDHSAVLVAFGAIGFVDVLGSVALVYHFRHTLRHDVLSERLEQIAHRVVIGRSPRVGHGAVVVGGARLVLGDDGRELERG